ncbi:immunity 51 family protein [Streptomyces sp. NPDC057638]|uniref:immunity 51 family protein n=1 Tax=Streptomyces sp. NPDC057638 TaxID=3346190 RepID=UPI003678C73C
MTDRETYAPLVFFEYDHHQGRYCLMLTDDAMVAREDVFSAYGYDGGGYAWTGVARCIVRTWEPEEAGRVGFDPEAGMFVAYGEDPEALRRLGKLMREAFEDPSVLREYVRDGEPDWFD